MANAIALFKKYTNMLDEVYKNSSKTAILDISGELVRAGANANEIIIPMMEMDGQADYSRNSGYIKGNVTITMQTKQFNYDRGRKFDIDVMDNVETAGLAYGKLSSEYIRTQVVPELDAFRFNTYINIPNATLVAGTLASGTDTLAALINAQNKMDEDEVPETDRHLFITPTLLNAVKNVDTTKSKEVLNSFTSIVKVPQSRFYKGITLRDGSSSGEEVGGYFKTPTTGKDINFLVVHKPAIIQYTKHTANDVILPANNPDSDGYLVKYRNYGLAESYQNKAAGVYGHHKA